MKNKIFEILLKESSPRERKAFFEDLKYDKGLADEYAKQKAQYVFDNLPYSQEALTGNFPKKKSTLSRIAVIVTRIAAILTIPLAIYIVYDKYTEKRTTIDVPTNDIPSMAEIVNSKTQDTPMIRQTAHTGVIAEVVLPDSSVVYLNSGSTIEFPAKFDSVQREIIFYGEGYFDIRSNKGWPMKIKTSDNISVLVRGTEFNLNNYENSPQFKLVLVKGNLSIYREDTNSIINVNEKDEIVINKGKKGQSSAYRNINSDISYNIAWKSGILKFKNTPMTEVATRLSNWYGYNIIIIYNQKIKDYHFTGEFHSETLIEILETIKISSNIRFSIMNKDVILY